MKKRYYLISCERGHLGRGKGATICFAIQAYNLPQAMNIARRMPAVKHTRMINYGREITEEEYSKLVMNLNSREKRAERYCRFVTEVSDKLGLMPDKVTLIIKQLRFE